MEPATGNASRSPPRRRRWRASAAIDSEAHASRQHRAEEDGHRQGRPLPRPQAARQPTHRRPAARRNSVGGGCAGRRGPKGSCPARRATRPPDHPEAPPRRTARMAPPRADRLPRPPAPRRHRGDARRALPHRRQRRALPRGGRGARHRGARGRRARLPLHARRSTSGSTSSGARRRDDLDALLRVRARRDRPEARDRGRLHPGPRGPHGASCSAARLRLRRRLDPLRRRRRAGLRPYDIWAAARRPTSVWRTYFEWLGEAAASGHVRHPRPPRPRQALGPASARGPTSDLRYYYEIAMEGIAESGIAVEVSTAGLRKPVGELYPSRAFLEMVHRRRQPDRAVQRRAHARATSGVDYEQALELLDEPRGARAGRLRAPRAAPGADRVTATHRHRLGLAPPRGRPAARCSAASSIPHDQGLDGYSDADVLTHAVIDALLGRRRPGRHRPALPRHRRALRAVPTRWRCCATSSPRSPTAGCASRTSTRRS